MKEVLIMLSSVLIILSILPYLVAVIGRKTKPRLVSWLVWTLLTTIACAASFTDHQMASATLLLLISLATATIFAFGFKTGDRTLDRTDIICMVGAAGGG